MKYLSYNYITCLQHMKRIYLVLLFLTFGYLGYAQKFQDTFSNMRLGSTISTSTVLYNVGARAVFSDETDRGSYVRVLFEDGNFGGEVWDFMVFQYTKEGRFYRFEVQKIFNNKVLADSFMSQLKARLSNKYPKAVIKDMGESLGGYIIYFEGDDNEPNKIRIHRSPFHPYYVILDYYNRYWMKKTKERINDEL